jgi:hypothetical protein
MGHRKVLASKVWVASLALFASLSVAQAQPAASPLGDYAGGGIRTSLLGTYVRDKEFVVYPFYEYTRTTRLEYKASDFKYVGEVDYGNGKQVEHEYLLFVGYAPTDSLLIEFESALYAKARFTKDPTDTTPLPGEIQESGLGDTEMQIRYRLAKESESRPDTVAFFKSVFPLQKNKRILGTRNWEFGAGVALTKTYTFGTMALRGGIDYDREDRKFKVGEYGLDYMTRLSPQWRIVLALEGQEQELSMIGELQWAVARDVLVKFNCGVGLSKNDRQVAPEVGIMFRF